MTTAPVIPGIRFLKKDKYAICHIDDFSDPLKNIIRNQLSSVCHGPLKSSSQRKAYNYKNTLKEFIKRYETKAPETKIGMIGEFITHILVLQFFSEFKTVSPYFNFEERSIKKGFDIVLFSIENNLLWITEVKSRELHKDKSSKETNMDLLGTAKRDLKKRLNENETILWENAINAASIALGKKEEIEKFLLKVNKEKTFRNVMVLSIQKETYIKVVKFLIQESKNK